MTPATRRTMAKISRFDALNYLRSIGELRRHPKAFDGARVRWDILLCQARYYAELSRHAQIEARAFGWRIP